jgi:maltose alpha-D-glucosyltransferase/alpha-amylase
MKKRKSLDRQPLWFKDAVIYELHVRGFADGDDDGHGDFKGLLGRLDYLEALGVTAIWLLPFYPSPLLDDGYDIADYYGVHPAYGTMADFKRLLTAAHGRGMKVITELVLNHTSSRHPWFQKSRADAPGGPWRDFYVWSDSPDRYADARIIFGDFETSNWTYDQTAKAYYWHRFYSHQPDLNYENPKVRRAMLKVVDFWLGLGVDGLRLDAVPYLFEAEGTSCENLPATHAFLRELRTHIDARHGNVMLLAEANQWPEDASAYFGAGDECHMAFHFPIMPRIFMALWREDRFPLLDILEQTPAIPASCQWAFFLRNHDELTLEMVTDEEREYMLKAFARDSQSRINLGIRRRLAPLMLNNRRRIELINILLFSLPGTPILYYGDEIGMGDNYHLGDRHGVRTPMQWSADRNAGFSRADPQSLYLPLVVDTEYHYQVVNVENQERNPSSLLWWMRRVLAMRRTIPAFGRGTMDIPRSDNPKVLCLLRRHEGDAILVVANLSRYSQTVRMDLSAFAGWTPRDVFSGTVLPAIGAEPYPMLLGFHDYFWLRLSKDQPGLDQPTNRAIPVCAVPDSAREFLRPEARRAFEERVLPAVLNRMSDLHGRYRLTARLARVREVFSFDDAGAPPWLVLVEASGSPWPSGPCLLAVSRAEGEEALRLLREKPGLVLCRAEPPGEGVYYDGIEDPALCAALLKLLRRGGSLKARHGTLCGRKVPGLERLLAARAGRPTASAAHRAWTRTTITYEDLCRLTLRRFPEFEADPEVEARLHCAQAPDGAPLPAFLGALEYRTRDRETTVLAVLDGWTSGHVDGRAYFRGLLAAFFERVRSRPGPAPAAPPPPDSFEEDPDRAAAGEDPAGLLSAHEAEAPALLGASLARLHLALNGGQTPDFRPERFTAVYQRSVYQSLRNQIREALRLLGDRLEHLPEELRPEARRAVSAEAALLATIEPLKNGALSALRARIHGNLHLKDCLFTGRDFQFTGLASGVPGRLGDRRIKRSPARDLAALTFSLGQAAWSAFRDLSGLSPAEAPLLAPWLEGWLAAVTRAMIRGYRRTLSGAGRIPFSGPDARLLHGIFLRDRALGEIENCLEEGREITLHVLGLAAGPGGDQPHG